VQLRRELLCRLPANATCAPLGTPSTRPSNRPTGGPGRAPAHASPWPLHGDAGMGLAPFAQPLCTPPEVGAVDRHSGPSPAPAGSTTNPRTPHGTMQTAALTVHGSAQNLLQAWELVRSRPRAPRPDSPGADPRPSGAWSGPCSAPTRAPRFGAAAGSQPGLRSTPVQKPGAESLGAAAASTSRAGRRPTPVHSPGAEWRGAAAGV
jgi:hypothetical protein